MAIPKVCANKGVFTFKRYGWSIERLQRKQIYRYLVKVTKELIEISLFKSEKKIHILSLRGYLLNIVVLPRSTLLNFTCLLFYKISDNKLDW